MTADKDTAKSGANAPQGQAPEPPSQDPAAPHAEEHFPETMETEPSGRSEIHDYSSAEALAEEGLPTDDSSLDPAALQAEIAELKDKLLRAVAEAENVRRRAERDKADAAKFGISSFARDLMSVADNFQRAMASVTPEMRASAGEAVENFLTGIEMTERELMAAFEKNGIRPIAPAEGERFDPNFHQAVAEVSDTDLPNGTVAHVIQTGYVLDDRVLRPAMVTVARRDGQGSQDQNGASGANGTTSDPGSTVNTTV